jgi:CheY-like chemotaxis protein
MAITSQRPHALIIEDELIFGMALQLQLSDLGFRSFAFASTELQAIEQAHLACPDLVTVDVALLDGNGVDAVETIIRACGPLPVVYVTGDRRRVDRPGAVVVEKPVGEGVLATAVKRAPAAPLRPHGDVRRASAPRGQTLSFNC